MQRTDLDIRQRAVCPRPVPSPRPGTALSRLRHSTRSATPVPEGVAALAATALWVLVSTSACGVDARDEGGDHRVFANLRSDASTQAAAAKSGASEATAFEWPRGEQPRALLEVADQGTIEIELLPDLAPTAVSNFQRLAAEGFYDATTFHRIIPGFMIQGGDPNTRNDSPADDGQGGPGYTLKDEFSAAPHLRGVVSMANTGSPNSSGSQFFIVHNDSRHLDGKYTVFGRVVSGIDVVDAIAQVQTDRAGRWGPPDRPIEAVQLSKVQVAPPIPLTADEN